MQDIVKYIELLKPSLAGKFLYYCVPFRKRIVLKNMNIVFSEALNHKQIKKLGFTFTSFINITQPNLFNYSIILSI